MATDLYHNVFKFHGAVFCIAADGLKVGNLDLTNCDMKVITLRDITTDPHAAVVSYTCNNRAQIKCT